MRCIQQPTHVRVQFVFVISQRQRNHAVEHSFITFTWQVDFLYNCKQAVSNRYQRTMAGLSAVLQNRIMNCRPIHSSKLVHKLFVEFGDSADPIGAWSKERRPEVKRSLLLAKARSRHDTYTSSVKQPQAIIVVGLLTLVLGCLLSLFW